MKILAAIDSFKGSATSEQLNDAALSGILAAYPDLQVQSIPIADGGEGVLDVLAYQENAITKTSLTTDLLGRKLEVPYLLLGDTAVIESAKVIGIDLVDVSPETISRATTYGLGAVVQSAIQAGAKTIIVSLGGTGTSDGGQGFLKSLGTTDLSDVTLIGASDVTNPYYGENGAATIFAAQKGATADQIKQLNQRDEHFAKALLKDRGIDLQKIPGAGAAGGLGGAIALLGGRLTSGFDFIADLVHLEQAIANSDLVLTGEGHLDHQSCQGKVVSGIAKLAIKHKKPCVALVGSRSDDLVGLESDLTAAFSIQTGPIALADALVTQRTLKNMALTAQNVVRVFKVRN
ncbi:glycerate kinase family protein [Lactococcus raffinolactis]|uniref:glycerate kinase family protein n=1 Tax=Pseudolactococcus raffinolactis TaxID=1366 RepID=UPI0039AF5145